MGDARQQQMTGMAVINEVPATGAFAQVRFDAGQVYVPFAPHPAIDAGRPDHRHLHFADGDARVHRDVHDFFTRDELAVELLGQPFSQFFAAAK